MEVTDAARNKSKAVTVTVAVASTTKPYQYGNVSKTPKSYQTKPGKKKLIYKRPNKERKKYKKTKVNSKIKSNTYQYTTPRPHRFVERNPIVKSYFRPKKTRMPTNVPQLKEQTTGGKVFGSSPTVVKSFVHLGTGNNDRSEKNYRSSGRFRSLKDTFPNTLDQRSVSIKPTQASFSGITITKYKSSPSSHPWPVILQSSTKPNFEKQKLENMAAAVKSFVHLGTGVASKKKVFERSAASYQAGREKRKVRKRVPKVDKVYSMNSKGSIKYGFKIQ